METSQIDYSEKFIKKLLDKLKTGNRRGIHLNAIPGRSRSRLDFFACNMLSANKAEQFLEKILSESTFNFNLNFDGVDLSTLEEEEKNRLHRLSKKLDNIVYDNDDHMLEFGIDNFGLGYPLLIKRDKNDPSKIIKAPLLIWSLGIEKSKRKKTEWNIFRSEDAPIRLNELLRSHISKDEQVGLERISEEFLDDGIIDQRELISIISSILTQLNHKETKIEKIKIEECPDKTKIESISGDGAWIQWSGVFGIYKSRKESIITQTESILDSTEEWNENELVLEKFQTSSVSAVATDPSKEQIINTLTDKEFKLIQGPPGTGKSQALTAIISNTVASGGKCLVVCEKKTALDVVFANLEKAGLGDLAVVIDDVNKDRRSVVSKARAFVESKKRSSGSVSLSMFEKEYEDFIILRDKINSRHQGIQEKNQDSLSFKDIIGMYLSSNRQIDGDRINDIYEIDFIYSEEEFKQILKTINKVRSLKKEVDDKDEILFEIISDDIYTKDYSKFLKDDVYKFLGESEGVCNFVIPTIEKYIQSLETSCVKDDILFDDEKMIHYQADVEKITHYLIELQETLYSVPRDSVNEDIFKNSIISDVVGTISKRVKKLKKTKSTLITLLERYESDITSTQIDLPSIQVGEECSFEELKIKLNSIAGSVEEIRNHLQHIGEASKVIKEKLHFFERGNAYLRKDLQFQQPLRSHEVLGVLSTLIEKILSIKVRYDSFQDVFRFKNMVLTLSENDSRLISLLSNHYKDSVMWENGFKASYLYYFIVKIEEKNGFQSIRKQDLSTLQQSYELLMAMQKDLIRDQWANNAREKVEGFESSTYAFSILYNLSKNRQFKKSNSLRKIIETDFDLFTSIFPVILINPIAADSILPTKRGIFEVVIFDEASQLRIEDTFSSMIRGQYKIIAGDMHQMPPSDFFSSQGGDEDVDEEDQGSIVANALVDSESLLDYANKQKEGIVGKSYLDYHYRSEHPDLIEFSNVAFYGSNLITFPTKMDENFRPITFHQVDGTYYRKIKGSSDDRERTNPGEVSKIVSIIKNDISFENDGVPSVGVATLNIPQRNAIIDAIAKTREVDTDFHVKMSLLEEHGFFVKNLENIQGDEKDIIILSTTFGIDQEGSFSQRFGPLLQEKGYKLLNVLVTRAKVKFFVCTSIPPQYYENYAIDIESKGNTGKGIFYAYISYARAVSEGVAEQKRNILNNLQEKSFDRTRRSNDNDGLLESPFEEEVYDYLVGEIGKEDIYPQYKVGGFRIDFVVFKGDRKIAIEADGKEYHGSNEAYAEDMYRQSELENLGFDFYRIWSTDWWDDREQEEKRIIKFINE